MLRRSRIDEGEYGDDLDDAGASGDGAHNDDELAPDADAVQGGDTAPMTDLDADPTTEVHGLNGLRLLVINDDPHSCELISRLVESLGCRARRVGSPEGVVNFIADPMNEIGGVILDLRAGVQMSAPVLEDIRLLDGPARDLPVIVLTSTADDPTPVWAAGGDMFLARPFHADDFLHEIERVLTSSPADLGAARDARG